MYTDYSTHIELNYPPNSEQWKEERKKYITSTGISSICNENIFKSRDDYAKEFNSSYFSPSPNENMLRGIREEPLAIKLYEEQTNSICESVSFCLSKSYPFLGATPDRIVTSYKGLKCNNRIVEVKSRKKFYDSIFESDYLQMQTAMGVCGKEYCDYVVYVNREIKIKEVKFSLEIWENIISECILFQEEYNL